MKHNERILIQGHRGARAVRPENTLAGFEYALEVGVDVLELDLAVTRDGVLVVSHAPYIDYERCTPIHSTNLGGRGPFIRSLTRSELRDTTIPTLEEVFQMVKASKLPAAREVRFNIETKSFRDTTLDDHPVPPSEFARLWLDVVMKHGMLERSILQSFDWRTLVAAKALDNGIVISVLTEDPSEDLVATAEILRPEWISPRWDMPNVTKNAMDRLHQRGVRIAVWTPNESRAWDSLIGIGVDSIITDDPAALLLHLSSN
jgi:glycerophosphoryl diester phosphodiesterase